MAQRCFVRTLIAFALPWIAAGCGSSSSSERAGQGTGAWDSAMNGNGNPFHPAHAYLADYAIDKAAFDFPEADSFRHWIVAGANQELHDLPNANPELEGLRRQMGGSNAAADRPAIAWNLALQSYQESGQYPSTQPDSAADAKRRAYYFLGILLHYVQDMGVPAHAFGVYHQSGLTNFDNFELMAFQKWSPAYDDINLEDPGLNDPTSYITVSSDWSRNDFNMVYNTDPNTPVVYTRTFFSTNWITASDQDKTFLRNRQGRTATVTYWALRAALEQFANGSQ